MEQPYDVGDYIAKDEIIVRLTDSEQRARVEATKGSLGEAQARFTEAGVAFERTWEVFERELILSPILFGGALAHPSCCVMWQM